MTCVHEKHCCLPSNAVSSSQDFDRLRSHIFSRELGYAGEKVISLMLRSDSFPQHRLPLLENDELGRFNAS
jgi:hypothetical protein